MLQCGYRLYQRCHLLLMGFLLFCQLYCQAFDQRVCVIYRPSEQVEVASGLSKFVAQAVQGMGDGSLLYLAKLRR